MAPVQRGELPPDSPLSRFPGLDMEKPASGDASSTEQKVWERAWSTVEIRSQSAKWNLAGDAGLLKHLQEFSQRMIQQTHVIEKEVDGVLQEAKAVGIRICNTMNSFMMLSNSQFVENRVYDDEEKESPVEAKKEEKPKSKEEREAELIPKIAEALAVGMSVLDVAFERVSVTASDSEEEDSSSYNHMLKAKDPYRCRPLPFLIGSKEFMEDDKVGLQDSSSEEESRDVPDSESESEADDLDHLPKAVPSRDKDLFMSESEEENSEQDFPVRKGVKQPSIISRGSDNSKYAVSPNGSDDGDDFFKTKPSNEDRQPVKNVSSAKLQDELNAKLGIQPKGVNKKSGYSKQPNEKQIRRHSEDLFGGDDNDDDSPFVTSNGLFSGGKGLFGDIGEGSGGLFGDLENNTGAKKNEKDDASAAAKKVAASGGLFSDDDDECLFREDMTSNSSSTPSQASERNLPADVLAKGGGKSTKKPVVGGLFDSDDDDDGDLFATPIHSTKTKEPIFADDITSKEPPVVNAIERKEKKLPTGAVSIFGNINPFAPTAKQKVEVKEEPQGVSPPQSQPNSLSTSDKSSGKIQKKRTKGSTSLFDDSEDEDIFSSLAGPQKSPETPSDVAVKKPVDLFGESHREENLFRPSVGKSASKSFPVLEAKPSVKQLPVKTSRNAPKLKVASLFDDSDSGDDLFSSASSTSSKSSKSRSLAGDVSKKESEGRKAMKKNLFDDEDNLFSDMPKVDLFGNGSPFAHVPKESVPVASEMPPVPKPKPRIAPRQMEDPASSKIVTVKSSVVDLFGEDFSDDLFKARDHKKDVKKACLFEEDDVEDLFAESVGKSRPKEQSRSEVKMAEAKPTPIYSTVVADLVETVKSKPSSIFGSLDNEEELFGTSEPRGDSSLISTQKEEGKLQVDTSDGATVSKTTQPQSPSKLSLDLNIDPLALLPGAKPPLKESPQVVPIDFDAPAAVNPLRSMGKERAKIQTRRRPPTRAARQKSLQKSQDDVDATISPSELDEAKEEVEVNPTSNPASNPLSPSTEEEDFFTVPSVEEVVDNGIFHAPTVHKKDEKEDPFGSESEVEELFKVPVEPELPRTIPQFLAPSGGSSSNSRLEEKPTNLFGDNDVTGEEEEDLFGARKSRSNNSGKKASLQGAGLFGNDAEGDDSDLFAGAQAAKPMLKSKPAKSLFCDDDEDDDLFSSKSTPKVIAKTKRQEQFSTVKKNEGEIFDDPLMASEI